jgi:hypothetical protein
MSKRTSPLDHVRVAAPCSAGWNNMIGNERVRFCGQCSLNVYNLSEMTKREAEHLIAQSEGRLCVRYYRRADGTILTKNCPVGLRAIKRRLSRTANASISAILSFVAGLLAATGLSERTLIPTATQNAVIKIKEPEVTITTGTFAAPERIMGHVVGNYAPADGGWEDGKAVRTERRTKFRLKKN